MAYKAGDNFTPTAVTCPPQLLEYANVIARIMARCNVDHALADIVEYTAQDINELYKDIVAEYVTESTGTTTFTEDTADQVLRDIKQVFKEETALKDLTPVSFSDKFVLCLYIDTDNGEVCLDMSKFLTALTFKLTADEAATLNAIDALKTALESNTVPDDYVTIHKLGGSRLFVTKKSDRISKDFMTTERFNAVVKASTSSAQ